MQKFFAFTIGALAMLLAGAIGTPAGAQSAHLGPNDPYCGAWSGTAWMPNGNCVLDTTTTATKTVAVTGSNQVYQRIRGRITGWTGNQVTLQRNHSVLVVNDTPASGQNAAGPMMINRRVIAHGYWQNGSFYVNRFENQ